MYKPSLASQWCHIWHMQCICRRRLTRKSGSETPTKKLGIRAVHGYPFIIHYQQPGKRGGVGIRIPALGRKGCLACFLTLWLCLSASVCVCVWLRLRGGIANEGGGKPKTAKKKRNGKWSNPVLDTLLLLLRRRRRIIIIPGGHILHMHTRTRTHSSQRKGKRGYERWCVQRLDHAFLAWYRGRCWSNFIYMALA